MMVEKNAVKMDDKKLLSFFKCKICAAMNESVETECNVLFVDWEREERKNALQIRRIACVAWHREE